MNPYDFVPIDWNASVERKPAKGHHRFDGLSGRIEGTITTLTPLFIPSSRKQIPQQFLTNRERQHIIPGTSLKGLIRSLVETIGPGCWWLFGGEHKNKLPRHFRQCRHEDNLCIACRMFGLINESTLLGGHVGFEDAVCREPTSHDAIYTIILGNPKPRHSAFYLTPKGKLAGRKFYFHHSEPPEDVRKWVPARNNAQNQYIKPIGPNSTFTFSAHFNNLAHDEFSLLLYALVLEPEMRHKIGYGKPAGLGSIEIKLTRVEMIDYQQRYSSPNRGQTVYRGNALNDIMTQQITLYTSNRRSVTLQGLRRIWKWPGRDDLQYPTWHWFQENSQKRLDQTP
jgi:CRISPR/Cas system CSM-associated protein Csm3 (group 7 of RAMP superfamily)